MSDSRAHTPSIVYRETSDPEWDPTRDPLHLQDMALNIDRIDQAQEPEMPDIEVGWER
ncbi:MAG TPA: hypothetical protein VK691_01065 [Solirubrobacteraceae bacterium]|jgi:hypothetical protein|nr:hypothetical protein [Solirubrobacteraceae bacterium]